MSSYIDREFKPRRGFWQALVSSVHCPSCGYLTGYANRWELLDRPKDFKCHKCEGQFSVAIPLGPGPERAVIERLLQKEQEFYRVRDRLADIIDELHGRKTVEEENNDKS